MGKSGGKLRVLITGGGGAGSEALARLLSPNYDVFFADADIAAKPYLIPEDRWMKIPLSSNPKLTESITDLCYELKIDLLVPTVDEELLPIARLPKSKDFKVLLPPENFVKNHLDKLSSNKFLHLMGLDAPETVAANQGRLDFPCIVKPRTGRGSRNVATVFSEAELQAQITVARKNSEEFIVQELLFGEEYTVMMASDHNGELHAIVPVLIEQKRGITIRAFTRRDKNVIGACQAIHAADPVPGCYNIQLIKSADGSVKPFEINPRISTTACLGLAAGIDFIRIFLGQSSFKKQKYNGLMDFKDCLGLKRSWYNEIFYS